MESGAFAFDADFGVRCLARKGRQLTVKRSRHKPGQPDEQPIGQGQETTESEPVSSESGRSSHREHQRSDEPDHEPRRGEVSAGQEP